MKFSLTRSAMLEGLNMVQNAAPMRSTIRILSHVLIKAEKGKLWFTTTDMDIGVQCCIEAEVEASGSTTLPMRFFLGIIRELPEQKITISVDEENKAKIEAGASRFIIHGMPSEDFPALSEPEDSFCYIMDQGVFREMLRKTHYAASADETRQVLNGVLLAFKEGKMTMVATDGRRLALVEQEVEFPPEEEQDVILPKKAVNELMHILGDSGELRLYAQPKQIVFEFNGVLMKSKLIEGVFPNYRQVIPAECQERVVIERESLLNALRRVSLINTEKSNATKLSFNNNELVILSATPDLGEGRETVPVKYAGKAIHLIFNPEFLIEPLRSLDDDEVILEMNDGHNPAVMKCSVPFLYVIMPLRVATGTES